MPRRVAIYIRTSSERQGEKVSPREQESACRKLASDRGYDVVTVYRDVERYRVRDKLVEPSGSRADRPGLVKMIQDGQTGLFEIIIAWKEDRLYRGLRPMVEVLELVEQQDIDIELVTEHFDRKMAPVKAWAAKMELESIRERTMMGRIGRLKDGKGLGGPGIMGYDFVDGIPIINDEEAEIVQFIFDLVAYGDADHPDGVPVKEIRRRLVARGYRQKMGDHKNPWARGVIYSILNNTTYLGKMAYTIDGESYPLPVEAIVDQATWDRAHEHMAGRVKYPVRNARELGFLLVGKLYCPHGHRMNYRVNRYIYATLADGTRKRYTRKQPLAYGTCSVAYDDGPCEFRRVVNLQDVEQTVWSEIAPLLYDVDNVMGIAEGLVTQWQTEHETYEATVDRLQRHLADLKDQRLWVVTQGRKGTLTDDDMAEQLAMLTEEERGARMELRETQRAAAAGDDLLAMIHELGESVVQCEDQLKAMAGRPIKDMSQEERQLVQRWIDATVMRVDLLGEGDDLRVKSDAFGVLKVMSNQSTPIHRH